LRFVVLRFAGLRFAVFLLLTGIVRRGNKNKMVIGSNCNFSGKKGKDFCAAQK
jgi:hypothetical protein